MAPPEISPPNSITQPNNYVQQQQSERQVKAKKSLQSRMSNIGQKIFHARPKLNNLPLNAYQDGAKDFRKTVNPFSTGGIRDALLKFANGFHQTEQLTKAFKTKEHLRTPTQHKAIMLKKAVDIGLQKSVKPKIGDVPIKGNPQLTKAYPGKGAYEIVSVYRGVKANTAATTLIRNENEQLVSAEIKGRGTDTDPYSHNNQGNQDNSALISFTTDPLKALEFSGREGVVVVAYIENGSVIESPDSHGENEVFLLGKVAANKILIPSEGIASYSPEDIEQALLVADRYENDHGIAENNDFGFSAY